MKFLPNYFVAEDASGASAAGGHDGNGGAVKTLTPLAAVLAKTGAHSQLQAIAVARERGYLV